LEFIDIHTHKYNSDVLAIQNYYIPVDESDFQNFLELKFETNSSIGIHPWYTNEEVFEKQLQLLRLILKNNRVFAIGECGLDRLKGPTLSLQEKIFINQIRISEEFRKPIIIHSVRSYSELLSIKKIVNPKVKMIIHGFNGGLEMAEKLCNRGFYLSFGASFLQNQSKLEEVLKSIDISKVFFETDTSEVNIKDLYTKAASILEIEIEDLKNSIKNNYLELSIYE
jgi:TatD DNase family protein